MRARRHASADTPETIGKMSRQCCNNGCAPPLHTAVAFDEAKQQGLGVVNSDRTLSHLRASISAELAEQLCPQWVEERPFLANVSKRGSPCSVYIGLMTGRFPPRMIDATRTKR